MEAAKTCSCTRHQCHGTRNAAQLVSPLVHTYLVSMLGFIGRQFLPAQLQRLVYLLLCALLALQFLQSETRTWTNKAKPGRTHGHCR